MANETTSSSIDDLIPEIKAEAMFQAEEQSLMSGLVKNFTIPMGSGKTVDVPIYNSVTASDLTEGVDIPTNTEITTSVATLTVGEVGLKSLVTDIARDISVRNVIADTGRLFGESIARKVDEDLLTLFNGFSVVIGDATTQITAAKIFEAVAKLKALKLNPAAISCVVHPEIGYDLLSSLTDTYGGLNTDIANEAMRLGYIGRLAGIPVFESANIVSTSGDSMGGVFHRDALGKATLRDITIEGQRKASLRGTELVGTAVYGVGELRDTYGIGMNFDSSIVN